ncbi:MAG TPA: DUF4962 domain-containing protein [Verrucomicrobiota bacterium]|nr:DUF4962 domain-containing protein [Verrucomicrobiota bacterium]HQL77856.1 DUF4962 domain-containing protein [Verrucomicrobiota bacterium]
MAAGILLALAFASAVPPRALGAPAPQGTGPLVSNRAAKPNEIGYRPADGAAVYFNPPSLTWLHEPGAQTYAVEWSPDARFANAARADHVPFNTYTHHTPLAPGQYFWRYRFTAKAGQVSNWSRTRAFVVTSNAVEFPMPTRAQQRERVPAGHPRLLLRPEDLPRLRAAAKPGHGATAEFAKLRAAAERLLTAQPTPEPTVRGSSRDDATRAYWWPNRVQTERACQEAETLAFVYLVTGEQPFGAAARRRIVHLAGWDPDGPTNFRLNCEAAKPLLFRLPRAYDWACDALTPEDRDQVRKAMRRRALDAWESGEVGRGVGHLNRPFSSHGNRTFHKLGECAIAFLGEIPEAETWLDYAVNKFYAAYPVWCDDDGGWHEGAAYWAGYMSKIVWWLQAAQSALRIDGLKKPFFAQVGDFPLYVAPPGSPNAGFGDLAYQPPASAVGGFMEYFQRAGKTEASHAGYWRWWAERWRMTPAPGIFGFLYQANLPAAPPARPPTDLPPSKVFRGIGVASLHTTLTNSADDVHLLFKSSPFGSQSHGHNPQNSFQLNAYGEALLTTCVYRDYFGSKFHYQWCHSTKAHNAVLVDGQGQHTRSPASTGRILDFELSPALDYVVGSAAEAYGGRLERYRRSVAFVKPNLIVICDDLSATNEATFQFMLHAPGPFTLDAAAGRATVEQPKAGATVQYLSPVPLSFRQWDGYEPKPERDFPNQWHLEAGTQDPRQDIQVLTVIVSCRAGKATPWNARRLESRAAVGVRLERDGKPLVVAFRKAHQPGKAVLEDMSFDKPVALFMR